MPIYHGRKWKQEIDARTAAANALPKKTDERLEKDTRNILAVLALRHANGELIVDVFVGKPPKGMSSKQYRELLGECVTPAIVDMSYEYNPVLSDMHDERQNAGLSKDKQTPLLTFTHAIDSDIDLRGHGPLTA